MKRSLLSLVLTLSSTLFFAQHTYRHLTVADGLPCNQVRQIVELPNHQMLVATEGNFCLFNGKNFTALDCNLDSLYPLPSFGGHDFMWQGDSLLWLKDYYSLYLFDANKRHFRYDYKSFLPSSMLTHFFNEHTDSLAQRKHDFLYSHASLLDSIRRGTDLQEDFMMAYYRDSRGGHWFGLQNSGVLYQPPATSNLIIIPLENDIPRKMVALDSQMMLIAGLWGIYLFDTETQQVVRKLVNGNLFTSEMYADHHGRVWISTNKGLYCYSQGEIQLFNKANVPGFVHDFVRFAVPVDEQRLLVCNYMHNLGYLYPRQHQWTLLNSQLPELDSYRTMIVAEPLSNRNHIAVCTQNGFFILDTRTDTLMRDPLVQQVAHFCRKYNCILHDRTGRLWVGTQNGLILIAEGRLQRITRAEGLSNQCIQAIAEDLNGYIWISTSNGVNRIRINEPDNTPHIRAITVNDGLPAVEMIERGICMMPDGKLYLASSKGIVVLSTTDFTDVPPPPTLELVGLTVAEEQFPMDTLSLVLNYRQNHIELQVSTLDYAHPKNTRYRYRVMQLEEGWHATTDDGDGRLATIRLSALPPGRYTVEVQASSSDNLWGETFRKTFIIQPPIWLTWWAKAIYLIIGLIGLITLMSEYLRRKREKMQSENEQRINELFELRENARHQFAKAVEIDPERLTTSSEEQKLIERMLRVIGENMSNTNYSVDLLARDIGMSRANLYKKMHSMLGITPNDFIRNVRLKHAAELLMKSQVPVNQLSLMVGFQTPRYFSQCFRKMFGVTPTEYREGKSAAP